MCLPLLVGEESLVDWSCDSLSRERGRQSSKLLDRVVVVAVPLAVPVTWGRVCGGAMGARRKPCLCR